MKIEDKVETREFKNIDRIAIIEALMGKISKETLVNYPELCGDNLRKSADLLITRLFFEDEPKGGDLICLPKKN